MVMKFLKCEICGNVVASVEDSGASISCCGAEMTEIEPNTADAATEKHVPVFSREGRLVRVSVGETDHPMTREHFISWIAVMTTGGNQRKELKPGDRPSVCFALCEGEEITAVYAYCNVHGLWKKEGEK